MSLKDQEALDAAYAIIHGGIGFLPMPGHRQSLADAAEALAEIEKLRQIGMASGTWDPTQWGYDYDEVRGQYERGLSQWRKDERKTTFQYSGGTPRKLLVNGLPEKLTAPLLSKLLFAHRDSIEIGMRVARACDELLPGYGFAAWCERSSASDGHPLRVLAYEPRESKEEVAAFMHRDRGFLSVTVYGSGPGFFIGEERKGRELPVAIPDDYAAVFAGRKFEQMTDGRVKALFHGTREVPEIEPKGRRGAVLFLHSDVELTIGT